MTTSRHYAKGVAKRAEILDAALVVFEREGEAGASLRAIAREADVSLAGLVHYFPTRDDLFTELQRTIDEQVEDRYLADFPNTDPGDLLARLMTEHPQRSVLTKLHLMLASATSQPEHPAGAYFADRYHLLRAGIAEYVVTLQGRGEVAPDRDPDMIAAALLAAVDGIQLQWTLDDSIDLGRHIRGVWALLLGRSSGQ